MTDMGENLKPLTNAELALRLSKMGRLIAGAQSDLAEGMWNPNFCAAEAWPFAKSLTDDLRRWLDDIDRRISGHD